MIAEKCNVNQSVCGLSPLIAVIHSDNHTLASLLLDAGVALQLCSSPLYPQRLAVVSGSVDVAELLISQAYRTPPLERWGSRRG
jgi:hypothetical protein